MHLQEWGAAHSLEDYRSNRQLRRATEREIDIAGEALHQLSTIDPPTAARITDLRPVVAMRNRLAHGYASVDDAVVWGIVQSDVPLLLAEVRALLEQEPSPHRPDLPQP